MGKSLIGFVVGVLVTSFAFVLIDRSAEREISETARAAAADTRQHPAGSQSDPSIGVSPGRSGERPADIPEAVADTPEARSAAADQAAWEAQLRRQLEQARLVLGEDALRMVGPNSLELLKRELAKPLEGMPIVSPTTLPPAFDWMANEPFLDLFHQQFQREYVDAAWATPMQTDLERLVYARPELVAQYGTPTIRCHSARCEVVFVASGERAGAVNDVRQLHEAALDLMPDAFDCEVENCWAVARVEDGVTSVFWGLVRK